MKHIAFVIPGLDRLGGAERQVIAMAEGLTQRGWKITAITLSGNGAAARPALQKAGIDFVTLEMRKGLADPRGWVRIHRWLRANRPDIVHAHLPHAILLARWSRLTAPIPVLVDTIHTSRTPSAAQRIAFRASAFLSDCTTAVSESAARLWLANGLIPPHKSVVLPNGIDTALWRPDPESRIRLRAELGWNDAFVWLAAGRLEPVKNHAALLHAMPLLPATTRLVIAGTGALEQSLRDRAAALGLAERVQFLGFVDDVLPWMQGADAVALASRWEGLPLVLLEAAACALPAVATDVPGSRDVIVPAGTGYLCAPGDPAQMAAAMQHIMRLSQTQRVSMGLRARAHAEARFSLTQTLDSWEALYRDLLTAHPDPARCARPHASAPVPAEVECEKSPLAPEATPSSLAETE